MDLYIIGEATDTSTVAIGLAKSAKDRLAELQDKNPAPLRLLREKKIPRGWDGLADTILRRELAYKANGLKPGWYRITPARAKLLADKTFNAMQIAEPGRKKGADKTNFGPVVTRLRTSVFGCSMEVFAAIAGTVTSTVSRWEKGELQPGLDELRRLRAFAVRHGLAWNDRTLFEDET